MSEIKVVKQPLDFVWNNYYSHNPDIFGLTNVEAHYDCYSFKILKPERDLFLINASPRLDIFTLGDVLFTASLSINYHFLNTEHSLKEMIFYVLQTAHIDFITTFDVRADENLKRYRPKFNDGKALEMIDIRLY